MNSFRDKLNEDEKAIYDLIGEDQFIELQKLHGGFSVYISKPHHRKAILSEINKGKSKREICLNLRMSVSQYYRLFNESSDEK